MLAPPGGGRQGENYRIGPSRRPSKIDASKHSRALTAHVVPDQPQFVLDCNATGALSLQSCRELHLPDQRVRQGLGLEHVACRLDLEQSRVNLAEPHQVVVRPLFCHDSILEHANPVRLPDR